MRAVMEMEGCQLGLNNMGEMTEVDDETGVVSEAATSGDAAADAGLLLRNLN